MTANLAQRSTISTGPFDEESLSRYLALSIEHYGAGSSSAHADHCRWKCLAGPSGPGVDISLLSGDSYVGRLILQRRDLRYGDQRFHGATPVDFLVDNRRAKTTDAVKLVGTVPRVTGVDMIVHTCNNNSAPIFGQMARFFPNYVERFELLPFGLPLRARRPLKGLTGMDLPGVDWLTAPWRAGLRGFRRSRSIRVEHALPAESELAHLADRFSTVVGLHSIRDASVLRWRFGEGPLFNGRVTYLRAEGRLVGYYVMTEAVYGGATVMALMDAVADPDAGDEVVAAIKSFALGDALDASADLLFTMLNVHSVFARKLASFPFLPLPTRVMKHRTPIFLYNIDKGLAEAATRDDAYILLTDLDYF